MHFSSLCTLLDYEITGRGEGIVENRMPASGPPENVQTRYWEVLESDSHQLVGGKSGELSRARWPKPVQPADANANQFAIPALEIANRLLRNIGMALDCASGSYKRHTHVFYNSRHVIHINPYPFTGGKTANYFCK